jgi:LysM repeat protein
LRKIKGLYLITLQLQLNSKGAFMRRFTMLLLVLLVLTVSTTVLAQSGGFIQHVIRPGENLYRISLRYGVTISQIMGANPFITNPNIIYAGTVLQIPTGTVPLPVTPTPRPPTVTPGGPTVTPPPPTTVPPTVPPPTPGGQTTYVVRSGDTLGRIAQRFGTTVSAIAQANNIVNPNLIYPGQVLIIPVPGGGTQPTPPPPTQPGPTVTPPPPNAAFELGGHVFSFSHAAEMRSAEMTWAKVQIDWKRGDSPTIVQDEINEARSAGFKLLLSLTGDPAELAQNPTQYYQDFATFAGQVASLGPDAIEVWNEQNIDREWPRGFISPQAYTQMLSAVHQRVKATDPDVLVISGAPAPTGFFGGRCTTDGCDDDAFIRGMAANNAGQFADCIGIHYNEGVLGPDARSGDPRGNPNHYTRYYGTMVDLYSSVFPGEQLCFTELGYLSPEGYPGLNGSAFDWAQNTTAQQQAEYLTRAVVLSRSNQRIRMLIVWNVNATTYSNADPQAGWAIIRPGGNCLACTSLAGAMQ